MDAVKEIFIALIAGGILGFIGNRAINKAQVRSIDAHSVIDLTRQVAELSEKLVKTNEHIAKNSERIDKVESKMAAMWTYIYKLVEYIRKHKLIPPQPPKELESDPMIIKLFKHTK